MHNSFYFENVEITYKCFCIVGYSVLCAFIFFLSNFIYLNIKQNKNNLKIYVELFAL